MKRVEADPTDNVGSGGSWAALLTKTHLSALLIVCPAVILHAADGLLVATMLPVILAEIGGHHLMSWVVMLYEIGSIIVGAASGYLMVRFGLRWPMALAGLTFALGCGVSACAVNMPFMLFGRLLQGLGGGGLMAMSFVAVTLLFQRHLRARVIGLISTLWAGSAFIGPLLGGLFVQYATWQMAFWAFSLIALALASIIVVFSPVTKRGASDKSQLPLKRLFSLSIGIILIALSGEEVAVWRTALLLTGGVAMCVVFFWLDKQAGDSRLLPKFDLLLRDRPSAMVVTVMFFAAGTIAIGAYAPFFLVNLHGLTPLQAGYLIAVEAIAWAGTAALVSGRKEDRDARSIFIGLTMVVIGVIGLAVSVGSGHVWLVGLSAALQGIGFGMAWTFIPRLATWGKPDQESALIAGAIPTVQRIGYAIGAALLGLVANLVGISEDASPQIATAIFATGIPMVLIGMAGLFRLCR